MTISIFWPDASGEKGVGSSCPLIVFTLEKGTRTFSFQSNEPSLKFIRPSLPQNFKCYISYSSCPGGCRGLVNPLVIVFWFWTILNKVAIWKFWPDAFGDTIWSLLSSLRRRKGFKIGKFYSVSYWVANKYLWTKALVLWQEVKAREDHS